MQDLKKGLEDEKRASSAARGSTFAMSAKNMNTLERAAERSMYMKGPEKVQMPSRNIIFAQARSSEPTLSERRHEARRAA